MVESRKLEKEIAERMQQELDADFKSMMNFLSEAELSGHLSGEDKRKYDEDIRNLYKLMIVRCKNCKHGSEPEDGYVYCFRGVLESLHEGQGIVKMMYKHNQNWFCGCGELKRRDDE